MTSGDVVVGGGLCLLPGRGLVAADVVCSAGVIAEIAPYSSRTATIDATGCLVLPGIVDIHGDAFERQIMPRPKTMFPPDMAMRETDRQLVANGITTAYHGITISWEPGLRSLEKSLQVIAALDHLEPQLAADNRIHIRWETFALDAAEAVLSLLIRGKTPLLAFNDHTTPLMKVPDVRSAVNRHAERSMVPPDRYLSLYEKAVSRRDHVSAAVRGLAAAARRHGVPMLSHDDRTAAERVHYRELGARVAEFPVTSEALDAAEAGGDVVVLGAPNVVRGGSHTGAIGAEDAVLLRKCSILASDYYYPALPAAALRLAQNRVLAIEQAWDLVSVTPAAAAGLADRGRIRPDLRADLVVVREGTGMVMATIVGGKVVYRAG